MLAPTGRVSSYVDKLILGTVQLGIPYGINNQSGLPHENDALDILKSAADAGIRWADTASSYGRSQKLIEQYNSSTTRRLNVFTKVKLSKSTPEDLKIAVQNVSKELQNSSIECIFFHRFEEFIELREVLDLQKEFPQFKWGVSVYSNHDLELASQCSEVTWIQLPFNLLDNESQRGHSLRVAKSRGKLIQVRSVFLQGLFFMPPDRIPAGLAELRPALLAIQTIAKKHQIELESLALQYPLQFPELIDAVLIGCETKSQLAANLKGLLDPIPNALWNEISRLPATENLLLNPANWPKN